MRDRTVRLIEYASLGAIFFVSLETTVRIEDRLRYGTPFLSPILSQNDLMLVDASGVHGRPEARYQKWAMNALGMRGPEVAPMKSTNTIRIVAVGASETFGLYESARREFPRQLEDTLNAWLSGMHCRGGAPQRVEVLNAALPGMSLPRALRDLRTRIRGLEPDIVVVYPTPAHYLSDVAPRDMHARLSDEFSGLRPLYPRVVGRVRDEAKEAMPAFAKTWLRQRAAMAYVRTQPPGWRFTSVPDDRMREYDGDVRAVIGAIRSMRAVPIVATHANVFMTRVHDPALLSAWESFYPRATGPVIVAFDSIARGVTMRAASDSAAITVDLARELTQGTDSLFSDFSHFTDDGAARAATVLGREVLAEVRESRQCTWANALESDTGSPR